MRIFYFLNTSLMLRKASIHMIMKFCEALQAEGADTSLVIPYTSRKSREKVREYYGIKAPFRIAGLPVFSPLSRTGVFRRLNALLFPAFSLLLMVGSRPDIIYIRDPTLLHIVCRIRSRARWVFSRSTVVAEVHELYSDLLPQGGRGRRKENFNYRIADKVVVMTSQFKKILVERGILPEKILAAHDGVDREMFRPLDKKRARRDLGIPLDKKLIVYTGHLDEWRGVHTLAKAMKTLKGMTLLIVGGLPQEREGFKRFIEKEGLGNVQLAGMVGVKEVATYISAADVVVLPNSGKYPVSKYYVSPLKLFEYMACKRPIVASDLPNLREVLKHRYNAFLVRPDSPEAFASGVRAVLGDNSLAERISENAYKSVGGYTWYARARKVIDFIS